MARSEYITIIYDPVVGRSFPDGIVESEALEFLGQYEVFHIMVEEGSFYRHAGKHVKEAWTKLLGQRAIPLADHTKLGEVIVSTIQMLEGVKKEDIIASWDGSTSLVVSKAIADMTSTAPESGVVRF